MGHGWPVSVAVGAGFARRPVGSRIWSPRFRTTAGIRRSGERVGIGHDGSRGAAYVEGWLKALEDDPKETYKAAADPRAGFRVTVRRHVVGEQRWLSDDMTNAAEEIEAHVVAAVLKCLVYRCF